MRDNYNQKIGSIICSIKDKNITSDNMLFIRQEIKKINLIIGTLECNLNCLYDYYSELYEQEDTLSYEEKLLQIDKLEYYADF